LVVLSVLKLLNRTTCTFREKDGPHWCPPPPPLPHLLLPPLPHLLLLLLLLLPLLLQLLHLKLIFLCMIKHIFIEKIFVDL